MENKGGLRATSVVAIIAEEYDGQRVFMAANATALGHTAVQTPGLVELSAAHLAGGFLDAIQRVATDDTRLQLTFGCFQVVRKASLF